MADEDWIQDEPDEEQDDQTDVDDATSDADTLVHAPARFDIDSYSADFPVEVLVSRIESEEMYIPPFQRNFVWSKPQASRLVESVLLGLPIPGLFFAKDPEGKLLVVDGQQRLISLSAYFQGQFPGQKTAFKLLGVSKEFVGKSFEDLDPIYQRQFKDAVIHCQILKAGADTREAVYFIFERINTGGTRLTGQEIRECIETGDWISVILDLNELPAWREMFGPIHKRGKDRELILRFFAMLRNGDSFSKPLNKFLDNYASSIRELAPAAGDEMRAIFQATIGALKTAAGPNVFKPFGKGALNAPAFETIAVNLAAQIEEHGTGRLSSEKLAEAIDGLYGDESFKDAIFDRTTNAYNVDKRNELASAAIGACFDAAD